MDTFHNVTMKVARGLDMWKFESLNLINCTHVDIDGEGRLFRQNSNVIAPVLCNFSGFLVNAVLLLVEIKVRVTSL